MDYSPAVLGISKTRILQWVAISFPEDLLNTEKVKVSVTQPCQILCDPMDCSLPGSSVHGVFQARILEWVAISCLRHQESLSGPRD